MAGTRAKSEVTQVSTDSRQLIALVEGLEAQRKVLGDAIVEARARATARPIGGNG